MKSWRVLWLFSFAIALCFGEEAASPAEAEIKFVDLAVESPSDVLKREAVADALQLEPTANHLANTPEELEFDVVDVDRDTRGTRKSRKKLRHQKRKRRYKPHPRRRHPDDSDSDSSSSSSESSASSSSESSSSSTSESLSESDSGTVDSSDSSSGSKSKSRERKHRKKSKKKSKKKKKKDKKNSKSKSNESGAVRLGRFGLKRRFFREQRPINNRQLRGLGSMILSNQTRVHNDTIETTMNKVN
ncbi:unnamed protein product [Allacma fusca]|uniref:Uncharacterized protein n=1 Tax=Allacma fusca TaxID=39272 RepID=A0A8J2P526_9HEXA|nr:unnamed protein product [Allacma fusca]